MFLAKVMQDYGRPDNESSMVMFDHIEHPSVMGMAVPGTSGSGHVKSVSNKAPLLQAQKSGHEIFQITKE